MERILIVEDDDGIAAIESDYLRNSGYSVSRVKNGQDGYHKFLEEKPDLIILDLNLPLINGYDLCKLIRKQSGIPIIMVTAKTKEIEELLGLELGADDYVKKPFSPKILVSRVKAMLKRPNNTIQNNDSLIIGDFNIDFDKRSVKLNDRIIPFTTVQFNIFAQLIQNPGKVFSRNELIDRSYDDKDLVDIYDRTMDSHIKNIRKLIEIDPKKPQYIYTVRGIGYKFNEFN
ncbi:response regulator transcription factor [Candidatus Dojkabacteria bacterium]|uniref:Transcriptional regulatory protein BaeR n=2 Tax=Candidatus Dojkabacteria TaxID=74243 RepID=A0A136KIQ0_9BACT|nr:MAG: Transcriptional regulatory protein BaeR [candidate division WS6 bacterium OLB21]MBW7954043.1 response regulator transcription factor [Candidatus Dojkabacteria bacterium]